MIKSPSPVFGGFRGDESPRSSHVFVVGGEDVKKNENEVRGAFEVCTVTRRNG